MKLTQSSNLRAKIKIINIIFLWSKRLPYKTIKTWKIKVIISPNQLIRNSHQKRTSSTSKIWRVGCEVSGHRTTPNFYVWGHPPGNPQKVGQPHVYALESGPEYLMCFFQTIWVLVSMPYNPRNVWFSFLKPFLEMESSEIEGLLVLKRFDVQPKSKNPKTTTWN